MLLTPAVEIFLAAFATPFLEATEQDDVDQLFKIEEGYVSLIRIIGARVRELDEEHPKLVDVSEADHDEFEFQVRDVNRALSKISSLRDDDQLCPVTRAISEVIDNLKRLGMLREDEWRSR
jgi:DNA-directed RNA polymerase subunit K/omega